MSPKLRSFDGVLGVLKMHLPDLTFNAETLRRIRRQNPTTFPKVKRLGRAMYMNPDEVLKFIIEEWEGY